MLSLLSSSWMNCRGEHLKDNFSIVLEVINIFERFSEEKSELLLNSGNCFMAQSSGENLESHQWERIDSKARTFRTSKQGGPEWENVFRCVTIDLDADKIIEDIKVYPTTSEDFLHCQLPEGVINIKTILYSLSMTGSSEGNTCISYH